MTIFRNKTEAPRKGLVPGCWIDTRYGQDNGSMGGTTVVRRW